MVVGTRTHRAGIICAIASALAPIAVLPHVLEDVAFGTFEGFGLSPLAGGLLVGAVLSIQVAGALGAIKDRRSGYVVVLLASIAWIVAVAMDHPDAFTTGPFREGLASRFAVWVIVVVQATAAISALSAMRFTRRTSFSGTGTYTSGGP